VLDGLASLEQSALFVSEPLMVPASGWCSARLARADHTDLPAKILAQTIRLHLRVMLRNCRALAWRPALKKTLKSFPSKGLLEFNAMGFRIFEDLGKGLGAPHQLQTAGDGPC